MSREWKPGDVAMLVFSTGELAIGVRNGPEQTPGWGHSGAFGGGSVYDGIGGVDDIRPLVVIDPADTEQVERLTDLMSWALHSDDAPRLQAALREFANPEPPRAAGGAADLDDEEIERIVQGLAQRARRRGRSVPGWLR